MRILSGRIDCLAAGSRSDHGRCQKHSHHFQAFFSAHRFSVSVHISLPYPADIQKLIDVSGYYIIKCRSFHPQNRAFSLFRQFHQTLLSKGYLYGHPVSNGETDTGRSASCWKPGKYPGLHENLTEFSLQSTGFSCIFLHIYAAAANSPPFGEFAAASFRSLRNLFGHAAGSVSLRGHTSGHMANF